MARKESDYQKLAELIKDIHVAMLTTVERDGTLHTRPLATLKSDSDDELWFFTKVASAKVSEIERDMHVSVAYADTENDNYVVVSGTAQVMRDSNKAKELWTPLARAWFPEGVDDPELALLRIRIHRAEYWTSPGKSAYLVGVAKAALSGKESNIGENRRFSLD